MRKAVVGDMIRIDQMKGEPSYTGKVGKIESIDSIGQLHGTWGGCAVIPEEDDFKFVEIDDDGNVLELISLPDLERLMVARFGGHGALEKLLTYIPPQVEAGIWEEVARGYLDHGYRVEAIDEMEEQ